MANKVILSVGAGILAGTKLYELYQEDQIKKEQEDIKLREWEAKFDQKQKEKEAEERLKDQRIKQKEMHAQMLKEQKDQKLNEELSSRLESFEVKQTREN